MKVIQVIGLDTTAFHRWHIEVDEYVPLRFRSYENTLGVKYIRLGNFNSSLLELLIDPNSMTVRGFTLTSFDVTHLPKENKALSRVDGLPVIAIPGGFIGPSDAQRIDIKKALSVGFGDDFVEIDLDGQSDAQRVVAFGNAEFYINSDELIGIRVVGLTPEQLLLVRKQQVK